MKKLSVYVTISNAFAACKESSDNSPGLVDFARLLNSVFTYPTGK